MHIHLYIATVWCDALAAADLFKKVLLDGIFANFVCALQSLTDSRLEVQSDLPKRFFGQAQIGS